MSVQQFVGSFECYPQIVAAVKKHEKTLDQLAYVDVKTEMHVPGDIQVVELRLVFRDGSIVYECVPSQKTDEKAMSEDGDTNWQPIETAPFNEAVLVFVPIRHHRLVIATKTDYGLWLKEDRQPMSYSPSHWTYLPTPPVVE